MLSIPDFRIPRKVTFRVARAEKLRPSIKSGKNKPNNKYKVIVVGGKTKESSSTEVAVNDAVQWQFTCTIKLHKNQKDPVALLVEDSDGHHKGQVVIPLVKIPEKPQIRISNQDPATSSNILCTELEPTNKCSDPSGFLFYWMWVEEYYSKDQLESDRKSFNKSVTSLFGSKNKLNSSKTHLEVKNSDSVRNFGSVSSLNVPEKHKKTPSLLKLNWSGKKKSKPTLPENKLTPDSSDTESHTSYKFIEGNRTKADSVVSNEPSGNPFSNIELPVPSLLELAHSYNSKTPSLTIKTEPTYNDDNYSESKLNVNAVNTTTIPQLPKENGRTVENYSSIKRINHVVPSGLPNKYNTMNLQELSAYKDPFANNETVLSSHPNDYDTTYRPGHGQSKVGSDYSLFGDRPNPVPQFTNSRVNNEELEIVKKENAELKEQMIRYQEKIKNLESDLDNNRMDLLKLRMKLLEEGGIKFLEIN